MSVSSTGHVFTASDKVQALERELKFRRQVYARRIAAGKMTEQKATWEIEVFEAILADLRQAAEKERLI